MPDLPPVLNVVIIAPGGAATAERLNAAAPGRLNIVDALGDFVPEMAKEWSPQWMNRFFSNAPAPDPGRDLEKLAREAHILVMALPYPKTLPTRTENLLWAHFPF